jgi:pimeloyl-ACP methyl ester carboxylesterase
VRTDDGLTLAIQHVGDGPVVMLANGIGVTRPGLDYLAAHLCDRYHVVAWDYRGIGASRLNGQRVALSVARHARDALQILDAVSAQRAVVFGWSMGVPVGLEMIRHAPERVAGLGALFGAPGRPFQAAFGRPFADLVHLSVASARLAPWPAQAVLRLGDSVPPLAWAICSSIGFVGREARRELFHADVRSTTGAQKRPYFTTMWELIRHDARDLLPGVRCPVLVVAGDRDWVTPPRAAEQMAAVIPGARLVRIPHASHFGVIECGPELWGPMDELLADCRL